MEGNILAARRGQVLLKLFVHLAGTSGVFARRRADLDSNHLGLATLRHRLLRFVRQLLESVQYRISHLGSLQLDLGR